MRYRHHIMFPIPSVSQRTRERVCRPFIQGFSQQAMRVATEDPAYAGPRLSRWFREQRKLGSRDRKIVSEIVYTLLRYERWFVAMNLLDAPLHRDSDLSKAFYWLEQSTDDVSLADTQFDLCTHLSLPDWMGEHLSDVSDPFAFAAHHQQRAPLDIRCNPSVLSRQQLQQKLHHRGIDSSPITGTTYGLRIEGSANLMGEPLFAQGAFEIQDAASQYFIEALQPTIQQHTTVLDYCAGAGGKSLAVAALGATVYAHEPRSNALKQLHKRATRAGHRIQTSLPTESVDIVIVDAPCSGTGRLRREPTVRWKWQAQPPLDWVPVQANILKEAAQYVKPTGLIAYATCSILPPENQHTLDGWHAERHTIYGQERNCDGFSWTLFRQETP